MVPVKVSVGGSPRLFALILTSVFLVPGQARAQFPGYGLGYGYGYPAYGYGYPGFGYGYPAYPVGFGFSGYGFGFGPAAYGYVAGFPPVLPYGGPQALSPYANPMFGLGLTPLGTQSYFFEANSLGRGQLEADRRARARELLRYGR